MNEEPITDNPAAHRWFFSDAAAVQRFSSVWRSWLGTPFRHQSCAKGPTGGVYCAALLLGIHEESGSIKHLEFPHAMSDYQPHNVRSKILAALRGELEDEQSKYLHSRFVELPVDEETHQPGELMHGDVLLLRYFRGGYHVPLITDPLTGQFVHAIDPEVSEGRIIGDSTYTGRTIAHFRALAL